MASSRSVITPGSRAGKPPYKRLGKATPTEKALVAQVVMDSPGAEVTPKQVTQLAAVLKRSPEMIKKLVQDASENFHAAAVDYVQMHKQAVALALSNGDAKSLDVAVKGSQWAIGQMASDGARVVEKASKEPQGQKIIIGIHMGSIDMAKPDVSVTEVVDAS